jgi:biotin carboxyl carrier protein
MTEPPVHSGSIPRLLIVDSNESHVAWLIDQLLGAFSIHKENLGPNLVTTVKTLAPALIILGEEETNDADLLAELERQESPYLMHFSTSPRSSTDSEANLYLHPGMSKEALLKSIEDVLAQDRQKPSDDLEPENAKMTAGEAAGVQRLLEVARDFGAQSDLAGASRVLERTLLEFLKADRAHCLYYSADDASLWTETDNTSWSSARDVSSETGIAGHVARTTSTVRVAKALADTRYAKATDDPEGAGDERIIAHPLLDPAGDVHAVLLAVRSSKQEEFSEHDEGICHWLTKQLAPLTAQLAMQLEVASVLEEAQGHRIFRQEAALAQATTGTSGDVVRVSPPWIGWSYWGLVVVLLGLGVFVCLAEIPDYSSGPVVIRESGRTEVLSPVSGNIENVLVSSGQHIQAGQKLATFYSPEESTQLKRLELEWQASLRAYLANRSDTAARNAVASLRLQRNQLLDKLTLRAPHGGIVNDVRTASGQHSERGETLLSISQPGETLSVIAFLPGADRPQLAPGMSLRMTLQGYPQTHIDIEIESISNDVMGPAEASRALGRGLVDSITLPSSVVVLRGTLHNPGFEVDGEEYKYSHGMLGLAEVKLRSDTVIRTLIPALKRR